MAITDLLTQKITLHYRTADGPEDEHGNPTTTTVDVDEWCFMDRAQRLETGVEETQQQTWTCYLRAGLNLDGWDAATYDGQLYEVIGPPSPRFNPRTQVEHHIEATLAIANPAKVGMST